jgi:hypothetical protein
MYQGKLKASTQKKLPGLKAASAAIEPTSPRLLQLKAAKEAVGQFSLPENVGVVVVDPISTGAMLAYEFMRRNIAVIRLYSRSFPPRFFILYCFRYVSLSIVL